MLEVGQRYITFSGETIVEINEMQGDIVFFKYIKYVDYTKIGSYAFCDKRQLLTLSSLLKKQPEFEFEF